MADYFRLIGLQIFSKTFNSVKKSLSVGWYPFIKCDNNIGTSLDVYPIPSADGCPVDFFSSSYEGKLPIINVSAVVGKNGAGKSSLIEIVYGILNNFTEQLLAVNGECKQLDHMWGLNARLHYELGGNQYFIHVDDGPDVLYQVNAGTQTKVNVQNLDDDGKKTVLKNIFYTIAMNYSLYSFNPADKNTLWGNDLEQNVNGEWLKKLFHKNDGYFVPIVLTPYRDEKGSIDVERESNLAAQRLSVLSLLFQSNNKEFLEGLSAKSLAYKFNEHYKYTQTEALRKGKCPRELRDVLDLIIRRFEALWEKKLEESEIELSKEPTRNETEIFYLAYKTAKICFTYKVYREAIGLDAVLKRAETIKKDYKGKSITAFEDGQIKKRVNTDVANEWLDQIGRNMYWVVCKLYETKDNHITAKIHKCLYYLQAENYKSNEGKIEVSELIKEPYHSYDAVMKLLPPSFIDFEIKYEMADKADSDNTTGVTIKSMSSGERQMLYALSYVFYHIRNIASVDEKGDRTVGYNHINLIFDEAELYYHPEFQRSFIKKLLDKLVLCHIDTEIIKSINILIITHSPFILSDIPSTNILYLPVEENDKVGKTLGGNIYDLLKGSFFLDSAIGEIAQQKLNDILQVYHETDATQREILFKEKHKEFSFTVSQLGEEYLYDAFNYMIREMESEYLPEEQEKSIDDNLDRLKTQIRRLEKRKEQLRAVRNNNSE